MHKFECKNKILEMLGDCSWTMFFPKRKNLIAKEIILRRVTKTLEKNRIYGVMHKINWIEAWRYAIISGIESY